MTKGSLVQLSLYVPIYIAARVAFNTYRHAEGYYWLNGLLFISHDYFTLACCAVIVISMLKIALALWDIGRSMTANCQAYISILASGIVVSIALYGLSLISINASMHIVRFYKFDPISRYVP
jgi:hypothetical protein